jgi:phosphatidylglycerophosphate synthase
MQTVDLFTFNRKISARLSALLIKTPLSPNHVTTLSMGAGLWAGYFFSQGTRGFMVLGAVFLQLAFILDNCDGDIARAKGLQSRFGMWYDFTADLIVDFALWSGLALGAVALGVPGAAVRGWWMAAMAGSAINYTRVTGERMAAIRAGASASAKVPPPADRPVWERVWYVLGQDGDPTLLVYAFALTGSPWLLLVVGAVYVNALWIFSWKKRTTTPAS